MKYLDDDDDDHDDDDDDGDDYDNYDDKYTRFAFQTADFVYYLSYRMDRPCCTRLVRTST